MSLIIAVWTNEGIVMGSDSRVSFSSQLTKQIPINVKTGHYFDSQEKTFLCPNNCGISTCGGATLIDPVSNQRKNITGFIKKFISSVSPTLSVLDTANNLLTYITGIDKTTDVTFLVSGYTNNSGVSSQELYVVTTGKKISISNNICNGSGAQWAGETDTLTRLLNSHFDCLNIIDAPGLSLTVNGAVTNVGDAYVMPKKDTRIIQNNSICWDLMSLQDAVDFVRYAINVTIETMKFANVTKTVGGPIDILVIEPNKSYWISHKKIK